MLHREAPNGIELTSAKINTFYTFKSPNVVENILDFTQEAKILMTLKLN